jgi:hypothetical protein
MASATVQFVNGFTYCVGVDTPSGEARNIAATGSPSPVPGAGGDIVAFSMTEVSTVEDLHTALGISASVSGGFGLFSASARFTYANQCTVHSNSVFLVVSVTVTNAFQSIPAPGITADASKLLAAGNDKRFRDEFGDMFVRGIMTGGQFFGVIQVITRDQSDSRDVSASLSASYAGFSASGTFDSSFSKTVSTHQTKVTCYREGGDFVRNGQSGAPVPTQVDAMIDAATSFPRTVRGNAVAYTALLDGYSILPLPNPPNFIDLQQQKDVLTQCAALRDQDLQWINDISYIAQNQDQFINVDPAALNNWRNDVSADLNTIAAAASAALNDPAAARVPSDLRITALTLPQRIDQPLRPGQVLVADFRGLEYDAADALSRTTGCPYQISYDGADGDFDWSLHPHDPDPVIVLSQDPDPGTFIDTTETLANLNIGHKSGAPLLPDSQ